MFTDHENREAQRAEARAKKDAAATEAFNQWLAKPETKFLLSTIPQSEHPEAVQVALRSAFDAGAQAGGGEVAGMFLDAILRTPKRTGL